MDRILRERLDSVEGLQNLGAAISSHVNDWFIPDKWELIIKRMKDDLK